MNTKPTDQIPTEKLCFSYIRFSSEGQRDGSSVDRQSTIAPRVANEKGWTLREDLNAEDLGVSAYKRLNTTKGALRAIIDAAKGGKIPDGTVCIVEAFDRLTRADIDEAVPLLWEILNSGLEIYIDRTSRHLTRASLKDLMEVMMALFELKGAFEYSDKISDRVKKAFAIKRNRAAAGETKMTRQTPGWVDGTTWKLISARAAIIRRIFNDYLNGTGPTQIARRLNVEKIPSFRNGAWSQSYVYKTLRNRQVVGEFQPYVATFNHEKGGYAYDKAGEAIPNYFPAVVSEDTFLKAQAKLNDNAGKPKTGKVANLFSGVGFCRCGQAIYLSKGAQKGYLTCQGVIKGLGCKDKKMMPYACVEHAFCGIFTRNPNELVRDDKGSGAKAATEVLRGRMIEIQKGIENITVWVIQGKATAALIAKQASLEAEAAQIKKELVLESGKSVSAKGGTERVRKILAKLETISTDMEFRAMVQDWIRANVSKIIFNRADRRFDVELKNGLKYSVEFSKTDWNVWAGGMPRLSGGLPNPKP
jgi:DNA invertase Pin-like site-specific DNA recombinase